MSVLSLAWRKYSGYRQGNKYNGPMSTYSHSAEELKELAVKFIQGISPRGHATVIALSGDPGAGKTTFSQGVGLALGVRDTMTSPTFVIENIYALASQKWTRLIHIDAYRMKSAYELETLGWQEIAADPSNLILLEWPERVHELIPSDAVRLHFAIEGEGRIITDDGSYSTHSTSSG